MSYFEIQKEKMVEGFNYAHHYVAKKIPACRPQSGTIQSQYLEQKP